MLSTAPRLYFFPGFASDAEIAHVLEVAADEEALGDRGIVTRRDRTGFSFEMPVGGDRVLEELARRIYDAAGMDNDLGDTMRFRRYEIDESHPLHCDSYPGGASTLIATAMLYLAEPEAGGETRFPLAWPEAIDVQPRKGGLVLWFSHKPNGTLDVRSAHEGLPVSRGVKATLTNFIYKPLPFARTDILAPRARPVRATFHHVDAAADPTAAFLLRAACLRRGVRYVDVDPAAVLLEDDPRLSAGDLLYRQTSTPAAVRAEQRMAASGVATFYRSEERVFFSCDTPRLLLERAGIPMQPSFFCATADPDALQPVIERLGGFPIVAGETRVDSLPALVSLLALVNEVELRACDDDAVRWYVVVVGNRTISTVAPTLRKLAVRALRALGLELGEVEIHEDARGDLVVARVDAWCDVARADEAGVDVAGMMVEHLLAKARRAKKS